VEKLLVKDNFTPDDSRNFYNKTGVELVSNAGFTKIYSLTFSEFVIYDNRVFAALGWLGVNYLRAKKVQKLPDSLNFSVVGGRGGDNRNPSYCGIRFKSGGSSSITNSNSKNILKSYHAHFDGNLKANKLLVEVTTVPLRTKNKA
jgi:hypothetical protein